MPITLAWFHSLCFSSRNQTEIARGFRLCWLGAPLSQPAPLKIISCQCHNLFAGQAVPPLSPTSGLWPSKWGAPAPPNCVVFCLQLFPFHPTCFPTPYSRKRPNRCLVLQKNVTGQCLIQYREEGAYGSKGSLPKQGTEHEVEKVSGPPFSSTLQFTTAPHRPPHTQSPYGMAPWEVCPPWAHSSCLLCAERSIPLRNAPRGLGSRPGLTDLLNAKVLFLLLVLGCGSSPYMLRHPC